MSARQRAALSLLASVIVCGIVTWFFFWLFSEPIIDVPSDPSQIASMSYKLYLTDELIKSWPTEFNADKREISGTVEPSCYPLVLACLIKEQRVDHRKEGKVTSWVILGTIDIELTNSKHQEILLFATYKELGGFQVIEGGYGTEYRGGNDLLFTSTLMSIHLVQKAKSK
jgi:hypothetical protein